MASAKASRLDQQLLQKIADKTGKKTKYVREQISKRAARLGIASEAAQVLWARELGIGTSRALRNLEPHMQEQVRMSLPDAFATPTAPVKTGKKSKQGRTPNTMAMAIDYLLSDDELRSRCKDLLNRRKYLDRVLREATTVLENRIRSLSGLKRLNPEALVNKALNPDPAKAVLLVSKHASEQAGFHSICRGVVLAFRHPSHHQLDDKVSHEDALKFCAFVDVLLDILGKATKPAGS